MHPDAHLFKPPTPSQTLRQSIYMVLKSKPTNFIKLSDLSIKNTYAEVRQAAKQLVKHGFATKHEIEETLPTKKNPENKVKRIALKFVEPWRGKKNAKW